MEATGPQSLALVPHQRTSHSVRDDSTSTGGDEGDDGDVKFELLVNISPAGFYSQNMGPLEDTRLYRPPPVVTMDVQLAGNDPAEGHFLARFLPRPLAPDHLRTPTTFFRRRLRVIHPLVSGTHPIIDAYDRPTGALDGSTLRERIRCILSDHDWSMVGVFRLALEDEPGEEPDQGNVTILVTVRSASMAPSRAEAIVRQIGSLLVRINMLDQTAIEVREAAPVSPASNNKNNERRIQSSLRQPVTEHALHHVFEREYQAYPRTGASLGPADGQKSGSLGFYLRLRISASECKYLAVTCHHVVSGSGDAVQPGGAAPGIAVASPSPDDHQAFLAGVKAEIQDFETSQRFRALEHRRALDDLGEIPPGLKPLADAERKYLADVEVEAARNRAMLATATSASTHLGVVYCSSGHGRTSGGSRDGCVLDWAAVEMDTARLGGGAPDEAVNIIPQSAAPRPIYHAYKAGLDGDREKSSKVGDISLSDQHACVKLGRTTGITRGYVTAVKPDCRTARELDDGQVVTVTSTEIVVISDTKQSMIGFSHGGDSGSLVFDSKGNAIAMLWAGDRFDKEHGAGLDRVHYVTPLKVLLLDVEKSLRAALGHDDWELSFV